MKYRIEHDGYAESPFKIVGSDNYVVREFDPYAMGMSRARSHAKTECKRLNDLEALAQFANDATKPGAQAYDRFGPRQLDEIGDDE